MLLVLLLPAAGLLAPQAAAQSRAGAKAPLVRPGYVARAFPPAAALDLAPTHVAGWSPSRVQLAMTEDAVSASYPVLHLAAVFNDSAAMDALRPAMAKLTSLSGILDLMYRSLESTLLSQADPRLRMETAELICRNYSRWLETLSSDEALSPHVRRQALQARAVFLDSRAVLHGMLWSRQASEKIERVAEALKRIDPDGRLIPPLEPASTWSRPEPRLPRAGPERVARDRFDMRRFERRAGDVLFAVEKAERRLALAREGPASPRLLARLQGELKSRVRAAARAVKAWRKQAPYIADAVYRMAFAAAPRRRVLTVPSAEGLKLVPEPGGWRIEAAFETRIEDEEVLATVKRSIEDHWRGTYESQGRPVAVRALVTIRRIPPESEYDPKALRLLDGGTSSSGGNKNLTLGRKFSYGTPAHEFGHLLGLEDEYANRLDLPRARVTFTQGEGSLMGESNGVARPRHLALAVRLLRRRRLVSGP